MGSSTKIEWTQGSDGSAGATWTPIRARNVETGKVGWHCEHVTSGCENCYSEAINRRLGTGLRFRRQDRGAIEISLDEDLLANPLRWRRPRKIFVCSMTDLFAEFVTDDMIDRVFAVMALCPQHTFQVLTKRAERMRDYMANVEREALWMNATAWAMEQFGFRDRDALILQRREPWLPLPHVWLGVSVEDQERADERVPLLLDTLASVRFLSCEPLLGPLNLRGHGWLTQFLPSYLAERAPPRIDWVIVGGESGPRARSMHPDWVRSLRYQCGSAGVPFFFKQWGEWIDADELRRNGARYGGTLHRPDGTLVSSPLNFTDAEFLAGGRPFEHQSDGTTLIRAGKRAAGRYLDSIEYNAFPVAP